MMSPERRRPPIERRRILRVQDSGNLLDVDQLAVEEPLEIRVSWQDGDAVRQERIAVTMRTPGADFELAAGFLLSEGVLPGADAIADVAYCLDVPEQQERNVVTVTLRPGVAFDEQRVRRNFYTTSSCGVCGKASIEAIEHQGCTAVPPGLAVDVAVIRRLPDALRAAQPIFAETGGLHGAGLADTGGRLHAVFEDVGRHNAVDKLIGAELLAGRLPLSERILVLSGRASFELVQKAVVARIPVVVAVGAPSSLAVQTAVTFGVTLAGFARAEGFNVYTGDGRITAAG